MARLLTSSPYQVQAIGQEKQSQYREGGYRPVLFIKPEYFGKPKEQVPDEAKIWQSFDADDGVLASLQRGTWVELLPIGDVDGKPRYGLKLMAAPTDAAMPPDAPSEPQPSGYTPDQKRAIAAKIEQHAALLRFCYDQAAEKFSGVIDEPDELRAIATTLFIQALR